MSTCQTVIFFIYHGVNDDNMLTLCYATVCSRQSSNTLDFVLHAEHDYNPNDILSFFKINAVIMVSFYDVIP